MKHGIPLSTIQKILTVLSHHAQVEQAILYGSRAKGNYTKGSDIDLTLCGGEDLSPNVMFRILDELDELNLPYTIDLSIYSDISDPEMIEHIQRVGIIFYRRSDPISDIAGVQKLSPSIL